MHVHSLLRKRSNYACTCAFACRGGGARKAAALVNLRPATSTFTSYVPAIYAEM